MLATLSRWRRRVGALLAGPHRASAMGTRGGFEAGEASRRLRYFQPSRAHLNTLIAAAGADITARARWLTRNNGYASNAIESWAGNVVGNGIKPSSLIGDSALRGCLGMRSERGLGGHGGL
jgi:capsid protein